jgi:hypothetical protein
MEKREECNDTVTVTHVTIAFSEVQILFRFKMDIALN